MFSLAIELRTARSWVFLYKSETSARRARDTLRGVLNVVGGDPIVTVADEYGTEADISAKDILGILFEDMNKCSESSIERGLHQARSQASLNRRAQSDPLLRTGAVAVGDMARMNGPQRFS